MVGCSGSSICIVLGACHVHPPPAGGVFKSHPVSLRSALGRDLAYNQRACACPAGVLSWRSASCFRAVVVNSRGLQDGPSVRIRFLKTGAKGKYVRSGFLREGTHRLIPDEVYCWVMLI